MFFHIFILLCILIGLYLLAIMPRLLHKQESEHFEGCLYAHRGLHDNSADAPENSIKAFEAAVEQEFGIEMDVQLTKDKVPVIMHDDTLLRSCGVNLKVCDVTYEELQQYKLFQSEEKIPTFQEALDFVDGRVPLIIELKIPGMPRNLCESVSEILRDYKGFYCIETFNPLGLIWYRIHSPWVIRGQLSSDFIKERLKGSRLQFLILKHLVMNFLTKPDFIAYDHTYKKGLSLTLCRKLYRTKTAAWTIQSQEDFDSSKKYFNFYIFDSFIPKL